MMKKSMLVLGCVALAVLLEGCASRQLSPVEADFGTSAKLAIINQLYAPEAGKNLDPVTGLDSAAAAAVMSEYRKSFSSSKDAKKFDVTIKNVKPTSPVSLGLE